MWASHSFLQVLFLIATTQGHPRMDLKIAPAQLENLHKNQKEGSAHLHADTQTSHKPRIMVSYENVYRPNQPFVTPNDPFQNILLYFLMNLGRDLAEEGKSRRSPDFFGDMRSGFTDVADKVVNGSKDVGKKVEDTYKTVVSRGVEEQYNPGHFFPHVGGSCMCYNRLLRRGALNVTTNGQVDFKHDLVTKRTNFATTLSEESVTEKKIEYDLNATLKMNVTQNFKIADVKTENGVPGNQKQRSLITADDGSKTNDKAIIHVVKLDDFNSSTKQEETTAKLTTEKKEIVITGEEIIVDLQVAPEEQCGKIKTTKEIPLEPSVSESHVQQKNANNKDGYYFLSSSGGTDKRTTALNKAKHYNLYNIDSKLNIIPFDDEDPLNLHKQIREGNKRRKRVRRHHISHDSQNKKKATLHLLEQEIRKRHSQNQQANKITTVTFISSSTEKDKSNVMEQNEIILDNLYKDPVKTEDNDIYGVPNLKSDDVDINYVWKSKGENENIPPQSLLFTVTIPTFLGIGILIIATCYVLRTKGWCCTLFTDKSKIIVVEVKETSQTQQRQIKETTKTQYT